MLVVLVHPDFNRLWAHTFSSLALVTVATVRNPSLGQPSNRVSALGASGDLHPSDYFSDDGEILIDSDGHAFNRGELWRSWGSASVVLSLLTTL
jgi:hypothetical protein